MKIGIVGLGNVGSALLKAYMNEADCELLVYDSLPERTGRFTGKLETAECIGAMGGMDIIFVTVNDSSIRHVLGALPESHAENIVIMSGIMKLTDLTEFSGKFRNMLIMHPLAVFPDRDGGIEKFTNTLITLQYSSDRLAADDFCLRFGCECIEIANDVNSVLYHAACVFASNYLVTLSGIASGILEKSGINGSEKETIILKLMHNTLNSINDKGIMQSLSGPIARGDYEDINKHLENIDDDDIAGIYRQFLRITIKQMRKSGRTLKNEDKLTELADE